MQKSSVDRSRDNQEKMPHRTTYFFPRQFPDRDFNKLVAGHEKKLVVDDGKAEVQSPAKGSGDAKSCGGITGDKIHGKQLAAFVKWLSDKKQKEKSPSRDPTKIKLYDQDDCIEEEDETTHRLLPPPLPPPVEESLRRQSSNESVDQGKERGVEPQVSLQRLSSEGSTSYAGSLFSGTTLDGNWSANTTGILKESAGVKEAEEGTDVVGNGVGQRYKEGYYLQLMFAKRLTQQAALAAEPLLPQERRIGGSPDPDTVSYRLWVCRYKCISSRCMC